MVLLQSSIELFNLTRLIMVLKLKTGTISISRTSSILAIIHWTGVEVIVQSEDWLFSIIFHNPSHYLSPFPTILTQSSYSKGKNGSFRIREKATIGANEMSFGKFKRDSNGSVLAKSRSSNKLRIHRKKHHKSNKSNANLSKSQNRYAENFFADKKNRDWLKKMGKKSKSKTKGKLIKLNNSQVHLKNHSRLNSESSKSKGSNYFIPQNFMLKSKKPSKKRKQSLRNSQV